MADSTETDPLRGDVREYLTLAVAPPDVPLLRRYFDACAGEGSGPAGELSEVERRWVEANLEVNPTWRAAWRRLEEERGGAVAWRPGYAVDRPARARAVRETAAPRWRAGAPLRALVLIVGIYGSLWIAGRAFLPETHVLAALDGYEERLHEQLRGNRVNGHAFATGAVALLEAPRTTLGLFPRYDRAAAERARIDFKAAFEASDDPFQRAEIAFFAAKASLMTGDVPRARHWLNEVLRQRVADYRGTAFRLLRALSAEA